MRYRITNANPIEVAGKEFIFLNLQTAENVSANITVPAEDFAKYRPGWFVTITVSEATKE